MKRVLLITTEPLPLPGCVATGAGIRAWALREGLRAAGLNAECAVAKDGASRYPKNIRQTETPRIFQRENLTEYVRQYAPDVLVMQHWGLMDRLHKVDCPLAIDLAGPHLLERCFWGTNRAREDWLEKIHALSRADFLTCSGEWQRRYFLGYAWQAGFDPLDPGLLPVIPFSLPADCLAPQTIEKKQHIEIIYGGMLLPWQNPDHAIGATLDMLEETQTARFTFLGDTHPGGDASGGRFQKIIQRIEQSPRASLHPPLPFDKMLAFLRQQTAALDLMQKNTERELAFPSRTIVYMASGLPVIYNNYSELSQWIEEAQAGWTLAPQDTAALREALATICNDPAETARRGQNARQLVASRLNCKETILPLAQWCHNPGKRQNKQQRISPTAPMEAPGMKNRLKNWLRRSG